MMSPRIPTSAPSKRGKFQLVSKLLNFISFNFSIDVAHELLKDGKVSLENEDIPAAIEELSDACDIFAR